MLVRVGTEVSEFVLYFEGKMCSEIEITSQTPCWPVIKSKGSWVSLGDLPCGNSSRMPAKEVLLCNWPWPLTCSLRLKGCVNTEKNTWLPWFIWQVVKVGTGQQVASPSQSLNTDRQTILHVLDRLLWGDRANRTKHALWSKYIAVEFAKAFCLSHCSAAVITTLGGWMLSAL